MKNDPAFPCDSMIAQELETKKLLKITDGFPGLTKRELFAALAMQGLLAAVYSSKEMLNEFTEEKHIPDKTFGRYVTGCDAVSKNAVSYADALLAELEKAK